MDSSEIVIWKATLRIAGVVQGVGFRPFIARLAHQYGLSGFVRNEGGQVFVDAFGPETDLVRFAEHIAAHPPAASQILQFRKRFSPCEPGDPIPVGFSIQESRSTRGSVHPTPDLAVCDDCLLELFTPGDPRYRNPFISCVHCGPRFTILKRLPYDRGTITMDAFPMCSHCDAQYHAPSDRRYHAQTVCCNQCGPVLRWYAKGEPALSGAAALDRAAQALHEHKIIAIKGIGGYHFACDARDTRIVTELRTLKGREGKPFAVMFPTLETLAAHCSVSSAERALLCGTERPIVLLRRMPGSDIAPAVYTTSPDLGAFLPYTPLQHLLFSQTGPLVMTSANPSGLPIVKDDAEMLRFCDEHDACAGVLWHDRAILRRLDDSVVSIVGGETRFVRRARGYVPLSLPLADSCSPPLLACGAQQKSTLCLSVGGQFYPSAEIGDLDNLETMALYRETAADMQTLLDIDPELVVCDMHPAYESTVFARETGLPVLPVQHHFAHIASVLAEYGVQEPVIGVAFDGTGYGPDGTVWGGEFLIASPAGFTRAGHLKAVLFTGSDESVRQGWKSAACMLYDAGLLQPDAEPRYATLKAALDHGYNTIHSSSMGRVFDAVSSLLGICHESTYEGQCAIELENAAEQMDADIAIERLPYALTDGDAGIEIDLTPCIRELARQMAEGSSVPMLAMRFHRTVIDMVADVCVRLRATTRLNTVALSGGVFHNRILLSQTLSLLAREGFTVLANRKVPAGDGGISLGQAYIGRMIRNKKEEIDSCVLPFLDS